MRELKESDELGPDSGPQSRSYSQTKCGEDGPTEGSQLEPHVRNDAEKPSEQGCTRSDLVRWIKKIESDGAGRGKRTGRRTKIR